MKLSFSTFAFVSALSSLSNHVNAKKNMEETSTMRTTTLSAKIIVTNLAPQAGTFQTPVWCGIHTGKFDTYDRNKTVTVAVERLAEDGNSALLSSDFANTEGSVWDGTVGSEPIAPGSTVVLPFEITFTTGEPLYFSYASMVIPSNDFWISNGDPTAHVVVNEQGMFIGNEIMILGNQVLDAGTEVNDELPKNTAFFGQAEADTGVNEDSYVTLATEGFKPAEEGGILADTMFVNADFTAPGYQMMNIKVVPVEGSNHLDRRLRLRDSSN
jgi:hypothetical protein